MKIVFMGTPSFAVTVLRALVENGYRPAAVVTAPDKSRGRHGTPVPSDVGRAAMDEGIPVIRTPRIRDDADEVNALGADLIVTAAFGQIVPDSILTAPALGCLNVHASLLPAYRGASPIQHAILDGVPETGVTVMKMDSGLDTGDILTQKTVPVSPEDTAGTLSEKLAEEGAALLLSMLPAYAAGEIVPVPQPAESTTSYAGMIRKEDGRIRWEEDARQVGRRIRAMDPWPGAFTTLDGKTIRIFSAAVQDASAGDALPGTILETGKEGITAACGNGILRITEVQMEGKKRMTAAAFLAGARIRERKFV